MKFKLPSVRTIHSLCATICFGLIFFAVYLQSANGLEPCPLCVLQRILIFCLGLLFLVGALHAPKRKFRWLHNISIFCIAILGSMLAARQIDLEHLPAGQIPSCGLGLEDMLRQMPFSDVIAQVFAGTANCAGVTWQFLGYSIPGWTFLFFIFFGVVAIFQAVRKV